MRAAILSSFYILYKLIRNVSNCIWALEEVEEIVRVLLAHKSPMLQCATEWWFRVHANERSRGDSLDQIIWIYSFLGKAVSKTMLSNHMCQIIQ